MKTRVIRRDGELFVAVPQLVASAANLDETTDIDVTARGEDVVISPRKKPTLEELVEKITDENRHPETDWGPAVGREVW